jgi:hypothetical protein
MRAPQGRNSRLLILAIVATIVVCEALFLFKVSNCYNSYYFLLVVLFRSRGDEKEPSQSTRPQTQFQEEPQDEPTPPLEDISAKISTSDDTKKVHEPKEGGGERIKEQERPREDEARLTELSKQTEPGFIGCPNACSGRGFCDVPDLNHNYFAICGDWAPDDATHSGSRAIDRILHFENGWTCRSLPPSKIPLPIRLFVIIRRGLTNARAIAASAARPASRRPPSFASSTVSARLYPSCPLYPPFPTLYLFKDNV